MTKKSYSNGEVNVTWEPSKCTHSGNCFRGLGQVFKPKEQPWIKIDAASSEEIINQVKKAPSAPSAIFPTRKPNNPFSTNPRHRKA